MLFTDRLDGFVATIANSDLKTLALQNFFQPDEDVRVIFYN